MAAAAVRVTGPDEAEVTTDGGVRRVRLEAGSCTCPWWYDHRGSRGPCKHVLAARITARRAHRPRPRRGRGGRVSSGMTAWREVRDRPEGDTAATCGQDVVGDRVPGAGKRMRRGSAAGLDGARGADGADGVDGVEDPDGEGAAGAVGGVAGKRMRRPRSRAEWVVPVGPETCTRTRVRSPRKRSWEYSNGRP
ncbi:SWIM zinc finger family protein [Microtetraspora sp. NBRC 13810]|uniref:SWIM zinc finger family protein n=1 Tax=Microtetraspora sp. NBRC 13810 TaxID=3030990 RepID=UPI00255347B3|nr:SWIM zinc finger family protein [Microtetraspora sp. NBRC 13810]